MNHANQFMKCRIIFHILAIKTIDLAILSSNHIRWPNRKMFQFKLTVLIIFGCCLLLQTATSLEVHFDRIVMLNASYSKDVFNISVLRIGKFNRTTYVLNFEGELYNGLPEDLSLEVFFYYNRFNNNQFYKTPARVNKESLCKLGTKYYKNFFMEQMKEYSNLPQLGPNDPFCPFPRV